MVKQPTSAVAALPTPSARSAYLPVWLAFADLAAVIFAARGIVSSIYTHDLYVAFEGGWRTYLGQRPFVDFHSPIGFAYYLPYVLLSQLEPFSLRTLMHANVVVACVYLVLATWTLPRRMTPLHYFLVTFGAVTIVISPRAADWWPTVFSHLAPYNRWGEGAMMLVAPLVLLARRGESIDESWWRRKPDLPAAIALAAFLFLLFHVKVTYCICSLGLVAVGLITRQIAVSTVVIAAAFCLAAAGFTEATLHLHRGYLADLDLARQATLEEYGKFRGNNKRISTYTMVGYFAAVLVLLKLDAPGESIRALVLRRKRLLVIVLGGFLVAAVENTQRHWQIEIPMMGAVLVVAAELIGRNRHPHAAASSAAMRRGFLALVLLGSILIPLVETVSIVDHTLVSRSEDACPVPAWKGTPGDELLFAKSDMVAPGASTMLACDQIRVDPKSFALVIGDDATADSARVEVARLTEAKSLLDGKVAPASKLFALDFANPYSVFTRTVPASGALLWWDLGRNYAHTARPDPTVMFRDVDYVLQSLYDPPWEPHGEHMWEVYGTDVKRRFVPVAEGRLWRLWQPRGR